MKKAKAVYICQSCGYESGKWLGRCPGCDEWNTFAEEVITSRKKTERKSTPKSALISLGDIALKEESERTTTGIAELDRVLGGGIFPASVALLAGEPGIGKSTLMLQMALKLRQNGSNILYISGEESPQQIKNRARRLGAGAGQLLMLAETDVEEILFHLKQSQPEIIIIDSIQSIYYSELSGAPGNVSQVRECAAKLFQYAKENGCSIFLVGHVTKEGAVAGPKILEHLVDVVIYFEGNIQQHRIIRSLKNRFGPANEIGVFEMLSDGLKEVSDPSKLFLNQRESSTVGSSIACSYEGSRPFLVEIQALVSRSNYGTPQRTVSGFDYRRLALILAVLEKHVKQNFGIYDVFVKIAGGLRIDDPAIDLAVAVALYSSRQDQPLRNDTVYIGELGLGGEIRPVSFIEKRLQEAQKMGLKQAFLSGKNFKDSAIPQNQSLKISIWNSIQELLPRKK
jgi:DNA repair protein RadA/Sms